MALGGRWTASGNNWTLRLGAVGGCLVWKVPSGEKGLGTGRDGRAGRPRPALRWLPCCPGSPSGLWARPPPWVQASAPHRRRPVPCGSVRPPEHTCVCTSLQACAVRSPLDTGNVHLCPHSSFLPLFQWSSISFPRPIQTPQNSGIWRTVPVKGLSPFICSANA